MLGYVFIRDTAGSMQEYGLKQQRQAGAVVPV
jgi:hypothetical protein